MNAVDRDLAKDLADNLEDNDLGSDDLGYDQPDECEFEAPRVRLPKPLVWGLLVLLGLAAVVLMAWGIAQSTWTYSTTTVGPNTRARLNRIRDELVAAGAPEVVLYQVERAAQPGVYTDDAVEALVEADKALESLAGDPSITLIRQELRAIVDELGSLRYGIIYQASSTPGASPTPLPPI